MNNVSLSQQQLTIQAMGKTFGTRAGAFIIDSVVLFVTSLAIQLLIGVMLGVALALSGREFSDEQSTQCLNLIVGLVLSALYFAIFEWLYGATVGKLVLGMRVVKENGQPCDFGAAFIRAFLRYIDGLFFGIPAYLNMQFPLYQRIGDKAAKTIVVSSKDSIIQQTRAWWWFLVAAGMYLAVDTATTLFLAIATIR